MLSNEPIGQARSQGGGGSAKGAYAPSPFTNEPNSQPHSVQRGRMKLAGGDSTHKQQEDVTFDRTPASLQTRERGIALVVHNEGR